jgi:hypothetical protein
MNIKISQLQLEPDVQKNDIFPILRNNQNYTASINSVYNLLSGDNIANVYTSYSQNSATFINDHPLVQSVYSTYNQNSGNYVSINTSTTNKWENVSTKVISSSANWDNTYSTWSQTSAILIKSDTTVAPQTTAIRNIVAIPLAVYEGLAVKDPYTFYVIV